jgi:hypothetical protein
MGCVVLGALLRDRKLAREGKASEGVVINCEHEKSWFRIEYEFQAENGTRIKGTSDSEEEYETGDQIWIIYLPYGHRRNHSYPLRFFNVVE